MSKVKLYLQTTLITFLVISLVVPCCFGHWGWGRRRRRQRSPTVANRDCRVSDWSKWSNCTRVCGKGYQERVRTIITQRSGFGDSCPALKERIVCGQFNGGCEHHCANVGERAVCSCEKNYLLQADKKSCIFSNPCLTNGGKGPCSQICDPKRYWNKGYVCSCNAGYHLGKDGVSCILDSCDSPEFESCPTYSYRDDFGRVCRKVIHRCSFGMGVNSLCSLSCPSGFGLVITPRSRYLSYFLKEYKLAEFQGVPETIKCILDHRNDKVWTNESKFDQMFCRRKNDPPSSISLTKNTLLEHSAIGTVVGELSSKDPQAWQTVSYTIQPTKYAMLFNINGTKLVSAWIPGNKDLNGKQNKYYSLTIKAIDNDLSNPMFITRKLYIKLININDPPSKIELSNTTVLKSAAVGTKVGVLTAIDEDGPHGSSRSSDFVWELIENSQGKFGLYGNKIVVAGSLTSISKLDHIIVVQCTDKDPYDPKKSPPEKFFIDVVGLNRPPKSLDFTSSMLYENASVGFIVGVLKATGLYGDKIKFDISTSDTAVTKHFETDIPSCKNVSDGVNKYSRCTVDVILKLPVNYELMTSYKLNAIASSTNGGTIFKTFIVNVLDVNEAPTKITLSPQEVNENVQPNVLVGRLNVVDPDNEERQRQWHNCSLNKPLLLPFKLMGLNLLVKKDVNIDYESLTNKSISILVTCRDDGVPPLSLTQAFDISVKDVNEPPDKITLSSNIVNEDAKPGHVIGVVSATDPDNTSQHFVYSVSSSPGFHLTMGGPGKQSLVLQSSIDYETTPKFSVEIKATDNGGLSTEKIFEILVKDVNEPPTDIKLLHQYVTENTARDTFISSVEVADPDKNSSATCKVVEPDAKYIYAKKTGLFATQKNVDYEAIPGHKFQLNINCTDNGGLSLQKSFVMTVRDLNEPPSSLKVEAVRVPENNVLAVAGQIVIEDQDTVKNYTCKILSDGKTNSKFEVDPTTLKITTNQALNFEQFHRYVFTVACIDHPFLPWQKQNDIFLDSGVDVIDVNEAPRSPCLMPIYIDENVINGTAVHIFFSYDPDNEAYYRQLGSQVYMPDIQGKQQVQFALIQQPGFPFFMGGKQYLIVKEKLNRGNTFKFNVTATDDGNILTYIADGKKAFTKATPISVTYTCVADILPSTDPRLVAKIDITSNMVNENAPNGTVVGVLRVIKTKPGAIYRFSLKGEDSLPFRITDNKLVVSASQRIDYETTKFFTLGVLATDQNGNTRVEFLTINVTDINEKPTDICLTGSNIKEGSSIGSTIGSVVVVDPDFPKSVGICASGTVPKPFTQSYTCTIIAEGNSIQLVNHTTLVSNKDFKLKEKSTYFMDVNCSESNSGFTIAKRFTITVIPSGCPVNFMLNGNKCVCKSNFYGPKCDRSSACKNANCPQNDVCVSHYLADKRCIPVEKQLPVLLRYTSATFTKNKVYNLENYLEKVFEGRSGNLKVDDVISGSSSGVYRKRRDLSSDVYVESTTIKSVSKYTLFVFVAMDPSRKYDAISAGELCKQLTGKGMHCINKEDCELLGNQSIYCHYASGSSRKKPETTSVIEKPGTIGLLSVGILAIFVVIAVCFIIRRRKTKKKEKPLNDAVLWNTQENPIYGPPTLRSDSRASILNNIGSPAQFQPDKNILANNPSLSKVTAKEFGNPVYDSISHGLGHGSVENPVFASIGPASCVNKQRPHLFPTVANETNEYCKPYSLGQENNEKLRVQLEYDEIDAIKRGNNSYA